MLNPLAAKFEYEEQKGERLTKFQDGYTRKNKDANVIRPPFRL